MRCKDIFLLILSMLLMAGCAATTPAPQDPSAAAAAEKPMMTEPAFPYGEMQAVAEGSLWSEITGISLFSDVRARKVGDVVVIRIEEDPQAQMNANTKTSRSSGIGAKLKFFGLMDQLAKNNPGYFAENPGDDDLIKSALSSDFTGKGSSDRGANVKAYITATVVKVLPNGNLYIRGRREIMVNNETQYIFVSGVIRPEDINTANEISSTYIADAKIMYSGSGVIAEKQQPGWLGRALDYVWPF